MCGPERETPGSAEGHAGDARSPQNSHQVDPTRPTHPGHHDDHRHHRRLPALPVMEQTHQHRGPGPLGSAAADEPRQRPGRRQQQLSPPHPPAVLFYTASRAAICFVSVISTISSLKRQKLFLRSSPVFLKPDTYSAYEISFLFYFLFINVLGLNVFITKSWITELLRERRRFPAGPETRFPFLNTERRS